MTQEDNDLLLKDLCARLAYGVKFKWCDNFHTDDYYTLIGINEGLITGRDVNQDDCLFFWGQDKIKPYLRPMSSMTEEEILDFLQIPDLSLVSKRFINDIKSGNFGIMVNMSNYARNIDWLNKNMFDYRGLIPKDIALSTEEFNPYVED